ncbi:hypothetical protein PYCC9005_005237 [Savitreella phatthalungensis]
MSNITLYTWGTPNGHKASITLEELGLKYEVKGINIGDSSQPQKQEDFLAINPNGRIPALTDGKLRVFESGAIISYLTDKYDKDHKISFEHGSDDYYEALSWLNWQMAGLGPMQGQANHFRLMAGARSDYGIKRYIDETKRLLGVLELQLSKTDYLVANKYSFADIASFAWVRGAYILQIDISEFPGVKAWVDRIEAREAVQRGVAVPSKRDPKEIAAMFDRMRAKIDGMTNEDKH